MAAIGLEDDPWAERDLHKYYCDETIDYLAVSLPQIFDKSFTFLCSTPTSWRLRMTIERWYGVNCLFQLQRTDNRDVVMAGEVSMKPSFSPDVFIPPTHFVLPEISPNSQYRRDVLDLVPFESLQRSGDRTLKLEVYFTIYGCHGRKKMTGYDQLKFLYWDSEDERKFIDEDSEDEISLDDLETKMRI